MGSSIGSWPPVELEKEQAQEPCIRSGSGNQMPEQRVGTGGASDAGIGAAVVLQSECGGRGPH